MTSQFAGLGQTITAPHGACLFKPGDESSAFLMVERGAVRVEQTNTDGRTVVLYRVRPGDSCVMTTACLVSETTYAGWGYAEGDVVAQAIPAPAFQSLLATNADFRNMVFQSFAQRVGELTNVIDALLLHRTDVRLAQWLADRPGRLEYTQMQIAQEIGTAREVVSRTLKVFEQQGWVRVGRGAVEVLDRKSLIQHRNQVS